jgi:hypothetical protein
MEVGGDKTILAEGASKGTLNPTVAVLAGMYIDYMKKAQAMGMGKQPTIAQQVLGGQPPAPPAPPAPGIGAPPAPPQPPMGAPAGLGATPEAAMMAPPPQEMPAPEGEMPMMAEGGMVSTYAGGGLSDVPVPDGMFDEPSNGGFNDGYAGGGLVAFAAGGAPRETAGQRQERLIRESIPGAIVTSRQRSAAKNAQVGGNPNSYHLTDQARDFVPPPGMSLTEFGDKIKSILGPGHDVVYNSKGHFDHVHTEPAGKRSSFPTPREVDTNTFAGRGMSLEDQLAFSDRMFNNLPREELEFAKAERRRELDPEYLEEQAKLNEAEAITAAGLELLAPEQYKGENILGSIAKAVKTGLSAYGGGKKEQKAAKNAAIRELMAYEELDRKTAVAAYEFGMDAYKLGITAEQAERTLAFDEKKLATTVSENAKDREVQMAAAMYRSRNPSDFDTKFAMYQKSYPGVSEVAILKQMKADGLLGSSQAGMALPGMEETGGAGDPNSGMTILGSKPVQ